MNDHTLAAEYINAGYNHKTILSDVSVTIPKNKISVILGANGCGKSTLLKTFARLLAPQSGQMILDGKNVSEIPSRQMAKMLGLLPQSPVVPEGIQVMDLVSRGRFPYRQFLKSMTREDYAAVEEAMEIMGITELADRAVEELSGGQRQRVWIALALAQQTDILLLDEPTAALDAIAENEMYEKYNEMLTGKTALFISHRLASTRFCDHILFLENGKITEEGTHEELMQENGGYAEMFLVQSRYYKEEGAQSHEEHMAGI